MLDSIKPDLIDCSSTSKVTGRVNIDLMIATTLLSKYPTELNGFSTIEIRNFAEDIKEQMGRTAVGSKVIILFYLFNFSSFAYYAS